MWPNLPTGLSKCSPPLGCLPRPAVLGLAYLTPPVELAIGLMVLPGLFTRLGPRLLGTAQQVGLEDFLIPGLPLYRYQIHMRLVTDPLE
jgi:hypothetical protein